MKAPETRRDRSAVTVPAADGYHFGDDHPWGTDEQNSLIDMLNTAREKFVQAEPGQEDEPYSDQLIRALQQLRARVEEVRRQHNGEVPRDSTTELMRMHGEARPIRDAWFTSKRPPPPAHGASTEELLENNRQAMHATAQEAEFLAADIAIDIDFSVEAIDNAIRVVQSQA